MFGFELLSRIRRARERQTKQKLAKASLFRKLPLFVRPSGRVSYGPLTQSVLSLPLLLPASHRDGTVLLPSPAEVLRLVGHSVRD